jgi:hypothetical protein
MVSDLSLKRFRSLLVENFDIHLFCSIKNGLNGQQDSPQSREMSPVGALVLFVTTSVVPVLLARFLMSTL